MNKPNWDILAVTRFLLAAIVMVEHSNTYTSVGFLDFLSMLGSFEAILGFLLISGFSIGKSIMRKSEHYFKRRIQRIYPVYIASIIFLFIVKQPTIDWELFALIGASLLFINHVVVSQSFVGPSWTLSAEVALYALAPFFLRQSRKKLVYFVAASFLLYLGYTCGRSLFDWKYYSGTNYGINIGILAFVWIAGFILAVHPDEEAKNWKLVKMLFIGHILLTVGLQTAFRWKHNDLNTLINIDIIHFIGISLCMFCVYWIVKKNDTISINSPFLKKSFSLAGDISYPLYLTHMTTYEMLHNWGIKNRWVLFSAAIVVSFLIYYLFDSYTKQRSVSNENLPKKTMFLYKLGEMLQTRLGKRLLRLQNVWVSKANRF